MCLFVCMASAKLRCDIICISFFRTCACGHITYQLQDFSVDRHSCFLCTMFYKQYRDALGIACFAFGSVANEAIPTLRVKEETGKRTTFPDVVFACVNNASFINR